MYFEHPDFKKPQDGNIDIWRYLTFTKFVAMIATNSLYFSNIRVLQESDPFEGTVPEGNHKNRLSQPRLIGEEKSDFWAWKDRISEGMHASVFVNCWHVNTNESAAMWKLY